MSGREVYDKISEITPDVKGLLSSGYSMDGQVKLEMERGCCGFIRRPYNLKDMSLKIRNILNTP